MKERSAFILLAVGLLFLVLPLPAQERTLDELPAGFDIQLIVNNVFDAVYYHPSNLPPSRYRQPQRSFRISAGYSF